MSLRTLSNKPAAALAAAGFFLLAGAAQAQTRPSIQERFVLCMACHGEGGISSQPRTPSLAGQPSFYAITQLFLFREGRRASAAMTAVAKGMTDDDLRAFSDFIGKLPPRPPVRQMRCACHPLRAEAALQTLAKTLRVQGRGRNS